MKMDDAIQEYRSTVKEPLWKTVLNWGAVLIFFSLPVGGLILQIYSRTHPGWFDSAHPERFEYVREFQRNLTILVFGLAGLRTWEQIKANGNKPPEQKQP